jgi:hypothetical protein
MALIYSSVMSVRTKVTRRNIPETAIFQNRNFSVVLYKSESSFLVIRYEDRLRVFENRVLRAKFGPKRDKVTGGWRKQHN